MQKMLKRDIQSPLTKREKQAGQVTISNSDEYNTTQDLL